MDVINYVSIRSLVNTKGEQEGLFFTLPTRGCLESCSLQCGEGLWKVWSLTLQNSRAAFFFGIKTHKKKKSFSQLQPNLVSIFIYGEEETNPSL